MRILHVTDTFAPTIGGIEALVDGMARAQTRAGHRVTVLTRTPAARTPATRTPAARTPAAPTSASGDVAVGRDPADLDRLLARADVVHAHVSAYSPLALRAAVRAASTGVPVMVSVHSVWGRAWPAMGLWVRAHGGGGLPIRWTAVSGVAADFVSRAVDPAAPVLVVPNAIDVGAWTAATDRADTTGPDTTGPDTTGPLTVVSTLRMTSRKRGLPLLRMLRSVRATIPQEVPLRAVLIGDGPELPRLRRQVARDLPWVELPGALPPDRIRQIYATAHVYAAPAIRESFGLAALEARTFGLPVVAMARSGLVDVLTHGVDGLLVDDDAAMAEAIGTLLTRPDLRAAMARHNRNVAPPADWPDVLARVFDAYAQAAAIADRPAGSPAAPRPATLGPGPAADGGRPLPVLSWRA